jgi:hypothetical protein
LSEELENTCHEITTDLKCALIAFQDFGLGATIAERTAYFEF